MTVVPVRVSTLAAGRTSGVLRTAAESAITVGAAEGYHDDFRAAGILLDPVERRDRIVAAATELAVTAGGCIDTEGESALIDQLTYLVESPSPLLGRFDPGYLRLPEAVLATVMRKHQRYLPVRDTHGALLPGDQLPATPAGAILSLADRLDYLAGLTTTIGLPKGSSDPRLGTPVTNHRCGGSPVTMKLTWSAMATA